MSAQRPVIGVFDSGFGGLTVLKALLEVEHLVIACNTATALAMDAITSYAHVPAIGVIDPGAAAAAALSKTRHVAVIGTEATIASHAYHRALEKLKLQAYEKACPLLVPLVEEGWIDHPVTQQVAEIYLQDAFLHKDQRSDVLLLGCTHYPLIRPLLRKVVPSDVAIVDSAESTAYALAKKLGVDPPPASASASGATHASGARAVTAPSAPDPRPGTPGFRFFVTDSVQKFRRLGAGFLGHPVDNVEHVDLGG